MKIVIEIPDGGVTDHRSRAAHCLHTVADFFEMRPVDVELSGTVALSPKLNQTDRINWTIEGVQQ